MLSELSLNNLSLSSEETWASQSSEQSVYWDKQLESDTGDSVDE